jgi:hypothetical protein
MEDRQPATDLHKDAARTLIVTAELDPVSFAWLDGLRRRHFPVDRNFLSAHLTMFHRVIPGDAEHIAQQQLPQGPLLARFTGVRFLGRGVAVEVASAPLIELRGAMKRQLTKVSAQDNQPW